MRRARAERRILNPDPLYHSVLVTRFVNVIMRDGKKALAERILYRAMTKAADETKKKPLEVLQAVLDNVRPLLEVKSRRVGGATYQVPIDVRPERRQSLAMRWLIISARARTGKPMAERLFQELLDASRGQGAAAKRREDLHRMAEANRAFVHSRW